MLRRYTTGEERLLQDESEEPIPDWQTVERQLQSEVIIKVFVGNSGPWCLVWSVTVRWCTYPLGLLPQCPPQPYPAGAKALTLMPYGTKALTLTQRIRVRAENRSTLARQSRAVVATSKG